MERHALITARILISIIFLLNGLNIIGQALAAHEMAVHGVPVSLIPALIIGARALQLIAGTALVLGIYPRVSAIALLLFLIPLPSWPTRSGRWLTRRCIRFSSSTSSRMCARLVDWFLSPPQKTNLFSFHAQPS
jgi:hypothetical protein